jgi:hypothetical protein
MMDGKTPETCWVVNKRLRIINWKIVASGWWFIWNVRWCTDLQTLKIFHIISQTARFSEKLLNIKCVFLHFFCKVFHSKKNRKRDNQEGLSVFKESNRHSCQILIKLELSWLIVKKYLNTKFHENPSGRSRFVLCVQTDITKLIANFRNFANAPKIHSTGYERASTYCKIIRPRHWGGEIFLMSHGEETDCRSVTRVWWVLTGPSTLRYKSPSSSTKRS